MITAASPVRSPKRPSIRPSPLRRVAAAVVLGGLLLRAIIPLGYMPGNLLHGEFMVLCPSGLPAKVAHALHLHHHDDGATLEADRVCPIGSALQYAALPSDIHATLPVDSPGTAYFRQSASVTGLPLLRSFRIRAPPTVTV